MKRSARRRLLWKTGLFFLLCALSLVVLVPLAVMVFGSFKDSFEVTSFDASLPKAWHWRNYAAVIKEAKLPQAFVNSIVISGFSLALTVLVSSIASFVIARSRSRIANFLYYFFFIGTLAPMQVIPTIRLFQVGHLYGSYLSVILIYAALNISFSCFLYVGFIRTIPRALDEAATIEGASIGTMFFKILFPLLKPVNVTITILIFMGIWNDINMPIYFLPDPEKWTMPVSVYRFYGMYYSDWNLVFADLALTALPVVIVYLLGQRYIVSGLTAGALKD
jgi:raffinose/stachyose/melibiose transport system permease protein